MQTKESAKSNYNSAQLNEGATFVYQPKKLNFIENETSEFVAESIFGWFIIMKKKNSSYYWSNKGVFNHGPEGAGFETPEIAMESAQSNFNMQVLKLIPELIEVSNS